MVWAFGYREKLMKLWTNLNLIFVLSNDFFYGGHLGIKSMKCFHGFSHSAFYLLPESWWCWHFFPYKCFSFQCQVANSNVIPHHASLNHHHKLKTQQLNKIKNKSVTVFIHKVQRNKRICCVWWCFQNSI